MRRIQGERIACITLDFELDYGCRIGQFNILEQQEKEIRQLGDLFHALDIPASAFIVTQLLTDYPQTHDILPALFKDYHCHSHTHQMNLADNQHEIAGSARAFQEHFGYNALGYRAPLGMLKPADIDHIKTAGFQFSASLFPSIRPGKFSNIDKPTQPFHYPNGLLEVPFAAMPFIRYTIAMSYIKLLGFNAFRQLLAAFGMPQILVFDSHLHDFIFNERSFNQLRPGMQYLWGRNKTQGTDYFKRFIDLLRQQNYKFMTMTELYHYLESQSSA